MSGYDLFHCIIGQDRADGISTKSVVYFAAFLHEECSEIDDWASEQLLKHENVIVLGFGEDFDYTVLQEVERCRIVTWFLQDFILLILFGLQVVNDVM